MTVPQPSDGVTPAAASPAKNPVAPAAKPKGKTGPQDYSKRPTHPVNPALAAAAKHPNAAPAKEKPAKEEQEEAYFLVRDTNATAGKREHTLMMKDGSPRTFTFMSAQSQVKVPVDVAIPLIAIKGFEVRDGNGNLFKTPDKMGQVGNRPLKYDEVVANIDELTHEALLSRALKAGGLFTRQSPKVDMKVFLVTSGGESMNGPAPAQDDEGDVDLEMDDDGD